MAKTRTGAAKSERTPSTAATTRKRAATTTTRVAKAPKLPKAIAASVEAARDKKATDIVVLDLRKGGGFTDYFVICSGNNARQITAIAEAVQETLKKEHGERPTLSEGLDRSEWVLLDYFNFVVHVFSRECRSFYDLERLWGNAERYEFEDVAAPADRH